MTFKRYKEKIKKDEKYKKIRFVKDGRNHYVYRITTPKVKYYYGSRSEKSEKIGIGVNYFTSSTNSDFVNSFKEEPNIFKIKILKIFDNRSDAIIYESFLHKKFNVKNNNVFINKSNQTPFGFDITNPSEEVRQKMSISSKQTNILLREDKEKFKKIQEKRAVGISNAWKRIRENEPERYEELKNFHVSVLKEANNNIQNNSILKEARRKKKSDISKKMHEDINADPVRKEKRRQNQIIGQNSLTPEASLVKKKAISKALKGKYLGEKNWNSKPIKQIDPVTNETIKVWPSRTIAAETLKINKYGISHCCCGRSQTAGGFRWKFISQ